MKPIKPGFLMTLLMTASIVWVYAQEVPSYWTGDTGIRLIKDEVNVQEGTSGLAIEINSTDEAQCDIRSKEIPVTAGLTYKLMFYYNTSAHVRVQAVLEWNGAATAWPAVYGGDGVDDQDYVLYTVNGTVPTGAVGVKVGVRFYTQSGFTSGEIQYLDNLIFESPNGTAVNLNNNSFELWQIRNWFQIINNLASDGDEESGYGYSVSVSGDYAVVGGYGSVYILYKYQNGDDRWGEVKKIPSTTGCEECVYFGISVSISGDYIVVGSFGEENQTGAAYIYYRNQGGANNWGLVKRIVASDPGEGCLFGYFVSIDGNTLVVSTPFEPDDENGSNPLSMAGAAYIYNKDQGGTGNWGQVKKIAASDRAIENGFGISVSISGDYIISGAPGNSTDASGGNPLVGAGAAYVFYRNQGSANNWGQVKKIVTTDRQGNDGFGRTVVVYGSKAAVSATEQDYDASGGNYIDNAGAVYLFNKDQGGNNNWGQTNKLVSPDRVQNDYFGEIVSISTNYAIIGIPSNTTDASGMNPLDGAGAVYIFYRDRNGFNNWDNLIKMVALNRAEKNHFGTSVCLSDNYLITGAPGVASMSGVEGRVYISKLFTQSGSLLFSDVNTDRFTIEWSRGDGSATAVFMRTGGGEVVLPADHISYSASSIFGSGSQIGSSGWYCVYKGTGTNVTVTGLLSSTEYTIMAYEYTGGPGSELYIPFTYEGNPERHYTGSVLSGVTLHVGNCILIGTTTEMQYSINSTTGSDGDWQNCTGGTTSVIFDEGPVYVRQKSVPSNFNLVANIPAAPEKTTFTVDFINEKTVQTVPSTVEYNYDNNFNTSNINGEGVTIPLIPGSDIYFRVKPTASTLPGEPQHLVVPSRPLITSYTINYFNETTNETVPASVEYSTQSDMTGARNGNNTKVTISPGTDLYFRIKATESGFKSEIYHLDVTSRPPVATAYTIDYVGETTNEVVSSVHEYAENQGFTSKMSGANLRISLTAGTDIYFRGKATSGSFASETQHLVVPARPIKPAFAIDFINETTKTNVDPEYEYSDFPDMAGALPGQSLMLSLTPNSTLYIRKKASLINFSGLIQELIVPARPSAPIVSLSDKNTQFAVFKKSTDGTGVNVGLADKYEYSTDGGIKYTQITDYTTVDVTGIKIILVRKMATTFVFASDRTGNLDFEKPVITVISLAACNGIGNQITVRSSTDNGYVYIVVENQPQTDVGDLNAAVLDGKGAVADIHASNSDIMISTNNIQSGNYYAYAMNDDDSLSDRSTNSIIIYDIPVVSLGEDMTECDGSEVTLDAGTGFSSYLWTPGNIISQSIQVSMEGEYIVRVTDDNECANYDTINVIYSKPYPENICLITIDLFTGRNLIVWNKTPDKGIVAYQLHRQTQVLGNYEIIGTIPYEALSIFKDTFADPEKRQWVYKLTTIDTCGNISDLVTAVYHKPLFLQYVSSKDGVNLKWEQYDVGGSTMEFLTYEIYRGSDSADLQYIDQVSADLKVYTDTDPNVLLGKYYYRVAGVKAQSCFPTAGKKNQTDEYTRSMSNLEDNKFVTGISQPDIADQLIIYPNPAHESFIIRFNNWGKSNYRLTIRDITGKTVLTKDNIVTSEVTLIREDLKTGYYFVELAGEQIFRGSIILE